MCLLAVSIATPGHQSYPSFSHSPPLPSPPSAPQASRERSRRLRVASLSPLPAQGFGRLSHALFPVKGSGIQEGVEAVGKVLEVAAPSPWGF